MQMAIAALNSFGCTDVEMVSMIVSGLALPDYPSSILTIREHAISSNRCRTPLEPDYRFYNEDFTVSKIQKAISTTAAKKLIQLLAQYVKIDKLTFFTFTNVENHEDYFDFYNRLRPSTSKLTKSRSSIPIFFSRLMM